jgi:hypothetical protein
MPRYKRDITVLRDLSVKQKQENYAKRRRWASLHYVVRNSSPKSTIGRAVGALRAKEIWVVAGNGQPGETRGDAKRESNRRRKHRCNKRSLNVTRAARRMHFPTRSPPLREDQKFRRPETPPPIRLITRAETVRPKTAVTPRLRRPLGCEPQCIIEILPWYTRIRHHDRCRGGSGLETTENRAQYTPVWASSATK